MKTKPKLTKKQLKKICKGLEPGIIYRVHENNETIPHEVGKIYKPKVIMRGRVRSTKTASDKGNYLITKVAICHRCGDLLENSKMRVPYCPECKVDLGSDREIKAYEKKDSEVPVSQIAFEITGLYQKVDDINYIQDVFEDMWRERMVG